MSTLTEDAQVPEETSRSVQIGSVVFLPFLTSILYIYIHTGQVLNFHLAAVAIERYPLLVCNDNICMTTFSNIFTTHQRYSFYKAVYLSTATAAVLTLLS